MDETNVPLPFVKLLGMTSGAFVRGTVGLILVRNIFNCFNFYSIDIEKHTFSSQWLYITYAVKGQCTGAVIRHLR